MLQIFDSLKSMVGPDMISKASAILGEKDSKVSSAVSAALPAMLAAVLKKGDSSQLENVLQSAGKSDVLSDVARIFSGNSSDEQKQVGSNFQQALLGGKVTDFNAALASTSGISATNAGKLTSMLSAVTAGLLGSKMLSNNLSLSGLIGELKQEKNSFMGAVPSQFNSALGLNSLYNDTKALPEHKKNNSWITWLIIIALLLLLFFWWRSCRRNDMKPVTTVTEYADTVRNRTNEVIDTIRTRVNDHEITLSNGTRITAARNGIEAQMIRFLDSDDYKKATDNDLRSKWFYFDDIRFEFGSASQLQEGSRVEMNNLADILKNYSDTKVRIAGNADRVGNEEPNVALSKERAEYIKNWLVRDGINANRITTEGHGEEFAKYSENAPDSVRSRDRDIAIRLVK